MTEPKIQLYVGACGKTRGGEIVEIVGDWGSNLYPWRGDNGCYYISDGRWHHIESQNDIIELLPPRQYVETPFEVGKTYPTRGTYRNATVIGFLLHVTDDDGYHGARSLDGQFHYVFSKPSSHDLDLLPTPIEDKPSDPCDGKTVEIEGRKYRLTAIDGE